MMKSCKYSGCRKPQYYAEKENVHMISTVIDQSLGLEFPIFQGGMAWVADASLAAGDRKSVV